MASNILITTLICKIHGVSLCRFIWLSVLRVLVQPHKTIKCKSNSVKAMFDTAFYKLLHLRSWMGYFFFHLCNKKRVLFTGASFVKSFSKKVFGRVSKKTEKSEVKHLNEPCQI
jgi:hypothetical protein